MHTSKTNVIIIRSYAQQTNACDWTARNSASARSVHMMHTKNATLRAAQKQHTHTRKSWSQSLLLCQCRCEMWEDWAKTERPDGKCLRSKWKERRTACTRLRRVRRALTCSARIDEHDVHLNYHFMRTKWKAPAGLWMSARVCVCVVQLESVPLYGALTKKTGVRLWLILLRSKCEKQVVSYSNQTLFIELSGSRVSGYIICASFWWKIIFKSPDWCKISRTAQGPIDRVA